jgi:hypothetical protein
MARFSKSLIRHIKLAVAYSLNVGHKVDYYHVRDIADFASGQELDAIQLDILTDMVIADLKIEVAS